MSEEHFKNFGMLIPKYANYPIGEGCWLNCSGEDFEAFKEYLAKRKIIQLYTKECTPLDLWQERNDLFIGNGLRINEHFQNWKGNKDKPTEIKSYSYSSFTIDPPEK